MKFGILGRLTDKDISNTGVLVRFINELVARVERLFKNNITVADNLNVRIMEIQVVKDTTLFVPYTTDFLSIRMLECIGFPTGWTKGALLSWQRGSGGFNISVDWNDDSIIKATVKILIENS